MERIDQVVDGIPILLIQPSGEARGDVVLWRTHLGGSAQQTVPVLERLAAAGHPAASFDPVLHGARGSGDPWAFATDVLAQFRRRMWPILGQTTLEAMRVLTWAQQQTRRPGSALAGDVSMGGDVAIALAGIDERVRRVATVGSTPDWTRPHMRELDDPTTIVDQGRADPPAQWYAETLDPGRHLDRYTSDVAITFELGERDAHVPATDALAFRHNVAALDPPAAKQLRVSIHPGLDHFAVTTGQAPLQAAVAWLVGPQGD